MWVDGTKEGRIGIDKQIMCMVPMDPCSSTGSLVPHAIFPDSLVHIIVLGLVPQGIRHVIKRVLIPLHLIGVSQMALTLASGSSRAGPEARRHFEQWHDLPPP